MSALEELMLDRFIMKDIVLDFMYILPHNKSTISSIFSNLITCI